MGVRTRVSGFSDCPRRDTRVSWPTEQCRRETRSRNRVTRGAPRSLPPGRPRRCFPRRWVNPAAYKRSHLARRGRLGRGSARHGRGGGCVGSRWVWRRRPARQEARGGPPECRRRVHPEGFRGSVRGQRRCGGPRGYARAPTAAFLRADVGEEPSPSRSRRSPGSLEGPGSPGSPGSRGSPGGRGRPGSPGNPGSPGSPELFRGSRPGRPGVGLRWRVSPPRPSSCGTCWSSPRTGARWCSVP